MCNTSNALNVLREQTSLEQTKVVLLLLLLVTTLQISNKLWYEAQQTPPPCCMQKRAKNSDFITFSVARWQHRTARRQKSNQIAMSGDNKLTFDPPTHLPELTLNLIRQSRGHFTPSLKISCKSVQPFSRNPADKEIHKEINKQRNRSIENRVNIAKALSIHNRSYTDFSQTFVTM